MWQKGVLPAKSGFGNGIPSASGMGSPSACVGVRSPSSRSVEVLGKAVACPIEEEPISCVCTLSWSQRIWFSAWKDCNSIVRSAN